ncbi:MAG: aminodeoxychorismate lyase [Gammaproteobacteria bacterium]|nr:aminodeoxychorismate lyase [Gammaproteobacteria bacterium]
MILVDGQAATSVDVADRGLAYGDGLFETIAWHHGAALALDAHLARLGADARRLGLEAPPRELLEAEIRQLGRGRASGVVKLLLTRGSGGRGYRPARPAKPRRIVSMHPWPQLPAADAALEAWLCRHPVSANPAIAGIKHLNRLDQVLASAEWPDEACFEGLMCDVDGNLVEGTRSNLFVRRADRLLTPGLERAGVAGIVRAAVLAAAPALGLRCEIRTLAPAELAAADELFVTNSIIGIRSLARVRGHADWVFTARDCAEQLAAHLRGQGVVA